MLDENKNNQLIAETDTPVTYPQKRNVYAIYWFILIAAAFLILVSPDQAKIIDTKRGWYIQPIIGPLIGLSVLFLFTACRLFTSFSFSSLKGFEPIEFLANIVSENRVALFSSALFFLYINTLSVFGFALNTLLFVSTLFLLTGLFNRVWFLSGLGVVVALVLIFRVGVTVWLPDVWLYNLLPENWADFANQYL